jgi:N-[(2S)-2-amino-2-carboxyethyl]-L-glutamate dehydrogenase
MVVDEAILYLSANDVETALEEVDPVAAVRDVLVLRARGLAHVPDEAYLPWTAADSSSARSLNMPGYVGGDQPCAGTKIINASLGNVARGLPRASGLVLLFDHETARVDTILEASRISALRTAAVSAVAAAELGTAVATVGVLGAGALAAAHLEVLPPRLGHLERVVLYDADEGRAASLRDRFEPSLAARGVAIEVAGSACAAVEQAELVVPVTTTTEGYIPYDWLLRGALVVNVSLDDVLPEVVHCADHVYVDDWELVRTDSRRLLGRMYGAGELAGPDESQEREATNGARRIDGELGDLLVGKVAGRRDDDEIVLVNPFGLAIEDLAVAARVRAVARERGLGSRIPR